MVTVPAYYGSAKWLFWLAAIILLLLATLGAAGVLISNLPWLFPAGALALALALAPIAP